MKSIRSFLTVVMLAAIVLVIFIATVQGYRKGIRETQQLLDLHLNQYAELLASSNHKSNDQTLPLAGELRFQIFDLGKRLIDASPDTPQTAMTTLAPNQVVDTSFQGNRWRVVSRLFPERGIYVVVAEPVTARFDVAERAVGATLLPMLLSIPVLALMAWIIISLGLRHLRGLATAVAERDETNFKPIALSGLPSELLPVVSSMNAMLARIEQSLEREKRFASDAAHELRTPISAIKVNAYNLQQDCGDHPQISALGSNLRRMSHLIDQLLLLYRTSSDNLRLQFEPVDLGRLCQQAVQERYTDIQQRSQDIELEGENVVISGNRFALAALVSNLVDNASKYTPEHGHIRLHLLDRDHQAELIVEDSGCGIEPSLRERVMDRFYRINSGSGIQGCGLGLSIVQHVIALHRGSLIIDDSQPLGGTRITVTLPCGDSRLNP